MATTPGNAINCTTTGITGFTGTGFTGTPVTAHNIIIGGSTSSTLAQAAPSATSGVPVISQGASADPIFGTAEVAGGGTGDTSFTAYSPICGGTTTTGALQSTTLGASGTVLTSTGTGSLPTFQTISGTFNPSAVIQVADDFLGVTGTNLSLYNWQSSFISGAVTESGHPGIVQLTAAGVTGSASCVCFLTNLTGISNFPPFILGGGAMSVDWYFKINTLSTGTNRYNLVIGLGDTSTAADQVNGAYFKYSDNLNSGSWQIITAKASTRTTSNSNLAAATGWHHANVTVNAAATSIAYSMDGVAINVSPIATNIPIAAVAPIFFLGNVAGTNATTDILIDLFTMTQTLTTPR